MTIASKWLGIALAFGALSAAQQAPPVPLVDQFQRLYSVYDRATEARRSGPFLATIMAPDYVLIMAAGTTKGGRQVLDELNQTFQSLPPDAEVHIHTTVQRVAPNQDGSVEIAGSSHLEITVGAPDGSITGSIRDILFDHVWIRSPRGFRLRVERIISEKQKTRTVPGH